MNIFQLGNKTLLAACLAAGACGALSAQTPAGVQPALERAALQARQNYRQFRPVAEISFEWTKPVYLSDMVHRRRPGFRETLIDVKHKTTHCRGVLGEGTSRVFTPSVCLRAPKGYTLKQMRLRFANGKTGTGSARSVQVKGDLAEIVVSADLTEGIKGAPLAAVAEGKTLREAYGAGVQNALVQFFMSRGVISARSSRLTGVKNTLRVGDPFYYNGKLVALVNRVPSRLPVSLWGGVSEDGLSLVRVQHGGGLLAEK